MKLAHAVHIGFPKTATSWLQSVVIPQLTAVRSLGRPSLVDVRYRHLMEDLVCCDPFEFNPQDFQVRLERLHEANRDALGLDTVKLISYEFLTGRDIYAGLDGRELLDRVFAVFGEVKIIITIREQREMVESVYRHYVGSGGGLHARELLFKRTSPGVDGFGTRCLLAKFRYDNTIRYCHDLFGPDRVKVFPYEQIRSDPESFVREFASFLTVPVPDSFEYRASRVNPSLSYTGIAVMRWINQLLGTPMSDSPFLRMVPAMWTRFVVGLFLPVDRLILRRWRSRRRFVDKRLKWLPRSMAKRLLCALHTPKPTALESKEIRGHDEGSTFVNLIRYLDWPDIDDVYEVEPRQAAERIADRLAEVYADSNARTASMTGLPLAELGYSVSPNDTDLAG